MSRRISVLVAATALAVSSFANAAERVIDEECARQEKVQQEAAQQDVQTTDPAPLTLAELFAIVGTEPSIETEDGVSAPGHLEVVVARIGTDGKPVQACVDSPEAAERFFKAQIEKLTPKQAKEQ
jgi:hypothetical protein